MKRSRLIGGIALGLVLVLVAAIAVIMVLTPGASGPQPERAELPLRAELLREARPDPACSRYPRPEPSGSGDVRLGVIRLRGHCLIGETVLVAEAEVEGRLAALRAEDDVVAADRDQPAGPPPSPKDPYAPAEGSRERQWSLERLGGERLRDLWPKEAPEIRVGIVDTGLDTEHAELAERVIKARDTELGSDGYASHGTFVAGIIAAADDGTGITGIAPKAKLLDAQYWRDGPHVGERGIHDEIIWSVDNGARVINASAGSDDTALLRAAYAYAELNRVVIVPAVGNCGTADWRPWPHDWSDYDQDACDREDRVAGQADQPTVLGVGALNEDGKRSGFSSENRTVMIMAPGEDLLSSCVTGLAGPRTLCTDQGTSFAAPQVTGAVAILLARHPEATPADIRQALIMTTEPVDAERGTRNDEYGYGRLDIIAAARYLDDHPPQPVPERPVITAAMITGIEGATHETELVLDDGSTIDVQGHSGEGADPAIAFSPDGSWFAAADGKTLTVVDAFTGRQQSVDCACLGVAFDTGGRVITLQGGGGLKLDRYDPLTADWTGTTLVAEVDPRDLEPARVVGAAGDVTLVTIGYEYAGPQRLIGVWPDGTAITLLQTREGIGSVAVSGDGRYVAAAGSRACRTDRRGFRLIDIAQTRKAGKAWATWLTPWAALSCAATSLHFEGAELSAGWMAADDGVRGACPADSMKSDQNDAAQSVTGTVPVGRFRPTDDHVETTWQEFDCSTAGVWHLTVGEQIRLRSGPRSPSLDRTPFNYDIIRMRPGGHSEMKLAEGAEIVAIRPR